MLPEDFDAVTYELTDGDLSKKNIIEATDFETAIAYLLIKRIKDLNDKKWRIEELSYMENLGRI